MRKQKAERDSTGHDHASHGPATEPAPAARRAAPRHEPSTLTAMARALARRVGDHRARRALPGPRRGAAAGGALQPKLAVNTPGDAYEREADRMADAAMRGASVAVSGHGGGAMLRRCACDGACAACRGEEESATLHRAERGGAASSRFAPPIVHDVLASPGQPLDAGTRALMENRMGADFGGVRVHTGPAAAAANDSVHALAFTVGSHIAFGEDRYQPGSDAGNRLLAHELAHTIQQGASPPAGTGAAGDAVRPAAGSRQPAVQRQENLRATRFSRNRLLELAFDGGTTISQRRNSRGAHVRLIQQSLLARGYALPVFGADGDFGAETETAVRAFQVDAGAVLLDGIVGPETLRLLDMHDPGGTTGAPAPRVGAPATPASTAAVFSEAATEPFAGYDASTTPNSLVVPASGRRRVSVAVTPVGARPTFVSDTPTVATVLPADNGVVVTGVGAGTANIQAQTAAGAVLATLRVAVKAQRSRSVAFHYVCDSRPAAAGGPHCSNGTPTSDEMRSLLNRVWERQANVLFTGGASHNVVVPGDLGPYVNDDGFGGDEMGTVTAAAAAPADYNVFRVWDVRLNHAAVNGGLNNGSNTLIADAPCPDGLGLAHECGHFMGLGHGSGFIMTPCGGRVNQRVSKAMADLVNP